MAWRTGLDAFSSARAVAEYPTHSSISGNRSLSTFLAIFSRVERLRRVFGIEITVCPHCGGRLRVIADVTDPDVIDQILEHGRREGLPQAPPMRRAFP